jgi:hypothetical protein
VTAWAWGRERGPGGLAPPPTNTHQREERSTPPVMVPPLQLPSSPGLLEHVRAFKRRMLHENLPLPRRTHGMSKGRTLDTARELVLFRPGLRPQARPGQAQIARAGRWRLPDGLCPGLHFEKPKPTSAIHDFSCQYLCYLPTLMTLDLESDQIIRPGSV